MRANFDITNISGSTITAGTTVDANSIPFDHATLVSGLMSRADGYDFWMTDPNGSTVALVAFYNANTATARIAFNLKSNLANGATVTYTLHHGDMSRKTTPYTASSSGSANVACVVTFVDPALPVPGFAMESSRDRIADVSGYPDALSPRSGTRYSAPRSVYSLKWAAISAEEFYEIRAFVHSQRGGAYRFEAASAASFLPNGTYSIQPDTVFLQQSSALGFAASMTVHGIFA